MFIAHGTDDDRVPVEKARLSAELLENAGAAVTYCEEQVGHKLSAKCFRGLEAFYQRVID
jgi:predicted esterase